MRVLGRIREDIFFGIKRQHIFRAFVAKYRNKRRVHIEETSL